jgi:CheY-like chemotaxis protein
LFVDDDADVRDAFADLLKHVGWIVAEAGDGQEALDWLAANPPPDVILLDLKMPQLDGYAFRARQVSDARLRDIPTLVFTADANVQSLDEPLLHGAPVVRKSADFAQLAAQLDAATRPRR